MTDDERRLAIQKAFLPKPIDWSKACSASPEGLSQYLCVLDEGHSGIHRGRDTRASKPGWANEFWWCD